MSKWMISFLLNEKRAAVKIGIRIYEIYVKDKYICFEGQGCMENSQSPFSGVEECER